LSCFVSVFGVQAASDVAKAAMMMVCDFILM